MLLMLDHRGETAFLSHMDDNLDSFQNGKFEFAVDPLAWCSDKGAWVFAFPFQVRDSSSSSIEGIIYLNPMSEIDYPLLWRLASQERLQVILLSRDLRTAIRKKISWAKGKREALRAIEGVDEDIRKGKNRNGIDREYKRTLDEFLDRCTVSYLLK